YQSCPPRFSVTRICCPDQPGVPSRFRLVGTCQGAAIRGYDSPEWASSTCPLTRLGRPANVASFLSGGSSACGASDRSETVRPALPSASAASSPPFSRNTTAAAISATTSSPTPPNSSSRDRPPPSSRMSRPPAPSLASADASSAIHSGICQLPLLGLPGLAGAPDPVGTAGTYLSSPGPSPEGPSSSNRSPSHCGASARAPAGSPASGLPALSA